jgi:hypothetical protein
VEADPKLPYIAMWWNPAKLYRKKAPKKGRENQTKGKDRKSGQANSPTKAGPLGGNGTTKNQTIAMSIWKLVSSLNFQPGPGIQHTSQVLLPGFFFHTIVVWYQTFLENFHTSLVLVLGPRFIFDWYEVGIPYPKVSFIIK